MRVHHLAVVVADLDAAERFYVGTLGLEALRRHEDEAGRPRSIWVSLGDAFLAIEQATAAGPTRDDGAPGWHCVALAIDVTSREAWKERLARAGHPVFRETAFTIYCRDPDGNIVALSHHPAPSPCAPPAAG